MVSLLSKSILPWSILGYFFVVEEIKFFPTVQLLLLFLQSTAFFLINCCFFNQLLVLEMVIGSQYPRRLTGHKNDVPTDHGDDSHGSRR